MTNRVRRAAPDVPISALVSTTTLNEERLVAIKEAGADIIGVGLDAATEQLFHDTRGRGIRGPHSWEQHWEIVRAARRLFGPWKVNCHIVVGMGETDDELVDLFFKLKSEEIAGYLFSFNPEPGTVMEDQPRTPIKRLRRIQLLKKLIEDGAIEQAAVRYDEAGEIAALDAEGRTVDDVVASGEPFRTDGCPDRAGEVACNRPYGSYRPGEEFRDYPFKPSDGRSEGGQRGDAPAGSLQAWGVSWPDTFGTPS